MLWWLTPVWEQLAVQWRQRLAIGFTLGRIMGQSLYCSNARKKKIGLVSLSNWIEQNIGCLMSATYFMDAISFHRLRRIWQMAFLSRTSELSLPIQSDSNSLSLSESAMAGAERSFTLTTSATSPRTYGSRI